MRILIVEDDFLSRRILEVMLDDYGCCDCVASGEEAIIAVRDGWRRKKSYDLICLDIKMPGLNGHEVMKLVREQEEENGIFALEMVPIIMVTTLHDATNILAAFRNGLCDVYLIKPVDPIKLRQKMSELGFHPMADGEKKSVNENRLCQQGLGGNV